MKNTDNPEVFLLTAGFSSLSRMYRQIWKKKLNASYPLFLICHLEITEFVINWAALCEIPGY